MNLKKSMKDFIYLGIIFVLLLAVVVNHKPRIPVLDNGSEAIVSTSKGKITVNELYDQMKSINSTSSLLTLIDRELLDDQYETTDEMKTKADQQIEYLKSQYGDNYMQAIEFYYDVDSIDEFKNALYLEFKREEAVMDKLRDGITEEELQDYYDSEIYPDIEVSHILIAPDTTDIKADDSLTEEEKESAIAKAEDEALAEANEVIEKLNQGVEFKVLVENYSDDEGSLDSDGSLGFINMDQNYVQEFLDAAYNLETDEYTKSPVKSQFGYHIIIKTDEKEKPSLEDMKADVEDKIINEELTEDETLYVKTLFDVRSDYEVQIYDDVLLEKYEDFKTRALEQKQD